MAQIFREVVAGALVGGIVELWTHSTIYAYLACFATVGLTKFLFRDKVR